MKLYLGKNFFFLLIGLILGIAVFWLGLRIFSPAQVKQQDLVTESSKYPHVRSLILPWDRDLDKTRELLPFRNDIDEIISSEKNGKRAEVIAYYFRDLSNGPFFGLNLDQSFSLASLLKVPVMMSYLRGAEQDSSLLSKKITFTGSQSNRLDLNPLTKPDESLTPGASYTVDELLQRMIVDSDNDAFQLLVNNSDVGLLADPYNITETTIQSKDQDFTGTLRDYAAFFRALYNASYLSRPYSEKALRLLIQSDFKDGLVAGVPAHIEVAHKFGIRQNKENYELHECGIVYYPQYPYLLCVMTKGKDLDDLAGVLKELSSKTYSEVNSQLSK